MIDKDFMDIIYKADGGKLGDELYQRIRAAHYMKFEEMLQPYMECVKEMLTESEYGDFTTYLDADCSIYVEESYKAGFSDCIRFMVSMWVSGNELQIGEK